MLRCRVCGRFIKREGGVKLKDGYVCRSCAKRLGLAERKRLEPPYEEYRCPRCGAILLGDYAVVDHYLEHRGVLKIQGVEIRELSDYRSLPPELKIKAYQKASRIFRKTS
ncbi:MAG: hypothetical protein J7L79_01525 [Thaumarchaeota archaeon]|nr:hypothetical protein [Nitrososphaerota archaeon]